MINSRKLPESVIIFGCGYLGTALAKHLLDKGVTVAALTRNSEKAAHLRKMVAERGTRFDQLARMVAPAPFLCGSTLSLADCGFVPTFAILNRLQPLLGVSVQLTDSIRDYKTALAKHPSVKDELQRYYEALDRWIATKLAV